MLEIRNLSVRYGKHAALNDISLTIGKGEMVAILGANGAGKSSLLNAIGRRVQPASGTMLYRGQELGKWPQHQLVSAGIALVPEGRGIFPRLSVEENLVLGALPAGRRTSTLNLRDLVHSIFPKLAERRHQIAGTMSGGEQQMVAIGRALMSDPDLLLLDEPSLGLAPIVAQEVFAALARIRGNGLTIMLVEQNARATLALADRAYLLGAGRMTGSGPAADLRHDPAVVNAFLGGSAT